MAIRYTLFAIAALFLSQALPAQPVLTFKRVEVRYPEITLAYKVTCGGAFMRDMGPQHFEIRENGILMKDATVWCPENDTCCISACLVFDRTGSMAGQKLISAKAAASTFVDLMQTPCDEAALVSFSVDVTTDVPMTNAKMPLKNAINDLKAAGNTALWDAAHAGITHLAAFARNSCKAVILITDGGENSSRSYVFRNVREHALNEKITGFTIGFGLAQGSRAEDSLRVLADLSGGRYYRAPNPEDLEAIFASMRKDIKDSFQECLLKYTTDCPDGGIRVVNLTIKNYCGGSQTATRSYQAPLDRSKFENIRVKLGAASMMGTQEVLVPLTLETPVRAVFSKCNLTVLYNRAVAVLTGVSTAGTLLEGVGVSMADIGSGHTIYVRDNIEIDGGGPLLYLRFKAADVIYNTETFLHISNWSMDAYCLIPKPLDGYLTIRPREPILACEVLLPERLVWNDDLKDYTPNPFTATVVVRNSGSREATRVKARIAVGSPKLELSSPVVFEQQLSPFVIHPGQQGAASWDIRSVALDNADSMTICFTVTSDNHPPVSCCRTLYVNPAQSSSLVCSLEAPDTVFFREQYYEPEEFDVRLKAYNLGTGQSRDVIGQLLQDPRFTMLSPASLRLAEILPPGDTVSGLFRVRMHPKTEDGFDTIRAHRQGDDTDPIWCERAVWVQRVRAPRFELSCSTPNEELEFSDETLDYVPNPFPITTIATNTGETYAEECQLVFVGPPRFTPVGGNLRPLGVMQVNESRTEHWLLRALPRSAGGWDTLVFQVLGRGGLGRKIVVADCRMRVYVPEVRRPEYELTCEAPDSLVYADNRYNPDPFRFTARIRNIGTASGRGLNLVPALPPDVLLAQGENAEREIPLLAPGGTAEVAWMLTPAARTSSGSVQICAALIDSAGASSECCREVFIPREDNPLLTLSCISVDTLFIDPATGGYAGNPFAVQAVIANTGRGTAENVRATLLLLGPAMNIVGAARQDAGDIEPGGDARLTWQVEALRRNLNQNGPFRILLEADNHSSLDCERSVFFPALRYPKLSAVCWSDPQDSLFFDWNKGEYEHAPFTLGLSITNIGAFRAMNVSAMLMFPPGIVLEQGEAPLKATTPAHLDPSESATVTWRVKATRQPADALRTFHFLARAGNADDAECSDPLFVQGAPKKLTLSLPRDILLRYGDKRLVPVTVSRTVGTELNSYRLELSYDPEVVSILHASPQGALTGRGWVGPVLLQLGEGRAQLSDYTTNTPIRSEEGILVTLQIEGKYNSGPGMSFGYSELRFTGNVLLDQGDIAAETRDGSVYVTNDCLEPLTASPDFELEQNKPNPCAGETSISFSIPAATRARLLVFDRMGRELAVLLDGEVQAGRHTESFDAVALEPGLYFYRLETPGRMEVKKLLRR